MKAWSAPWVMGLALSGGCAYSTPKPEVPEGLPAIARVDVVASEVILDEVAKDLSPESADEVRALLGELLTDDAGRGETARVRAKIALGRASTNDTTSTSGDAAPFIVLAAVFVGLGIPLGLTVWHETAKVTLTVQVRDQTFEGYGESEAWGSVYASARDRAIARAVQLALLDADERGRVQPATTPRSAP
jgi:hypothetical protein